MTDTLSLDKNAETKVSPINVLKIRNFRLLWIGEGISLLGDQFYMIALPWLVLSLTGNALAVGTVMAMAGISRALFLLVGGALTDRFTPRKLMINSNLARMVLTGLLAALVATNLIQLWMLFNSLVRYLPAIAEEQKQFGIDATKWLMDTGIQNAEHYPVESGNFLHMLQSSDLDALFETQNVQIIEKRAAGLFSMAGEKALNQAKADKELWELILNKKMEIRKDSGSMHPVAGSVKTSGA